MQVTVNDVLNWVGSDNFHPNEFASIIMDLVNGDYKPHICKNEILMLKDEEEPTTTEIKLSWHADDVLSRDSTLTAEQVGQVLDNLKNNHDATIGVNWEVIDMAIDIVKEE